MRTLSTAMQTLLASGQRVEPVTILAVTWVDGSNPLLYADRDIVDPNHPTAVKVAGRILEMGQLDEAQRSDSTGSAGSVGVTLDDRDGSLKGIFNSTDIHKRRVDVYQSFMGLSDPSQDRILIFSGQVSTPIVWDEGKRTFSFQVVTKLEDFEVGWSAELGDYSTVAVELLGRPWPLVFGTVHHSPCLRLQDIPTAFTTEPFGIGDRTVATQLAALAVLLQEAITATLFASLTAARNSGSPVGGNEAILDDPDVKKYVKMQADIQDEIDQLKLTQGWQATYSASVVGLVPTVYVNQAYNGLFRVGDNLFNGTLSGTGGAIDTSPQMLPGSPAAPALREGYQFYNAGTQAVIAGLYPLKYVASVVPGTVRKVWAMRSFNGLRQMAEVPSAYYTTSTEAIGKGMVATYITLRQPLSTVAMIANLETQTWENTFGKSLPAHIVNQIDWEDELYVSFESSIGPNAVDIMEWLIANFSGNGYDTASFAAARDRVAGLPMNFTLAAMPEVMGLLGDIAYQARCLIYLRDDVFYLLYLPAQGAATVAITEDDVMVDGLKVTTTGTEELVTKYVATYRPDYSPFFDAPVTIVLRYGIPKYGTHEEQHDFYCYNSFDATQVAATFWLIRKSQTWKILQARLLLTRLDIEVFDYVGLHFAAPYVAAGDVVGLVTRCVYDSASKWVDVEIWCPVLLGEMRANAFAFPASASEFVEWPQYHALAGGGGGGLSTPELPPSNPRSEPAGVTDVGGRATSLSQPVTFGQYVPGEDWIPPQPAPIPNSKLFPFTPLPLHDPTKDYAYKTPPDPAIANKTGVFPGCVRDKVGADPDFPGLVVYKVDVYEAGLANKPTSRTVGQLQIDKDDTIPDGTWTEVAVTQGTDANNNPYLERTMQIPVWLS